jgi:hypothetical protein
MLWHRTQDAGEGFKNGFEYQGRHYGSLSPRKGGSEAVAGVLSFPYGIERGVGAVVMGGLGSGRRSHSSRVCGEHCRIVDSRRWVRLGILGPLYVGQRGWSGKAVTGVLPLQLHYELFDRRDGPAMRVSYALPNEQMYYEIGMQTTQPRLGGVLWWFKCPLICSNGRPCGRRVQMLYLPPNGRQFGCRGCHVVRKPEAGPETARHRQSVQDP